MSEKDLIVWKCTNCGKITYPKRIVCPNCRGKDFVSIKIEDEGKLITYTKLYATPEGIEQMPLVLGILEFSNGVRMTGQIEGKDVKIGDKFIPKWDMLRKIQGRNVYGFKFTRAHRVPDSQRGQH
jgi:uncharacterized OB-fold protein